MRAAQKLPDSYVHYRTLDPNKCAKVQWLLMAASISLVVMSYILFNRLSGILCEDFAGRITFKTTFNPVNIVVMLTVVIIVLAAHELIHGLFLWLFTRERPTFVVGIWAGRIEARRWYLPRSALLATILAPLCLLSLAGLMLLLLVPKITVGLVVLGLAVNVGVSTIDMASSIFIFLQPASSYFSTNGVIYVEESLQTPQGQESEPKWKVRFRLFLERVLSRLE